MIEKIKDATEIAYDENWCSVASRGFDVNGCAKLRYEFYYYVKYYP